MCEPTTAAMATMAVVSAAASVKAQQDQADYQSQMNERQYKQTMATYAENSNQVNLQGQQLRDQTLQKLQNNQIEAAKAQGKAINAAGATGVTGNSVDMLLGDLSGQSARYQDSVQTNYASGVSSLENQRQNIHAQAANTINGLKTPQMPDYMTAGMRIADAGYKYNKEGGWSK